MNTTLKTKFINIVLLLLIVLCAGCWSYCGC